MPDQGGTTSFLWNTRCGGFAMDWIVVILVVGVLAALALVRCRPEDIPAIVQALAGWWPWARSQRGVGVLGRPPTGDSPARADPALPPPTNSPDRADPAQSGHGSP